MKKLLFSIWALLLPMLAWGQSSNETSLYRITYEGVTGFPRALDNMLEFVGETGVTLEMVGDGLAINNPGVQNTFLLPQVVLTDDCITLEEGHNYIVRLTMKVPSNGDYYVMLGNRQDNSSKKLSLTASDNFQVVDFDLTNFPKYVLDNGHIRLLPGLVSGTTIVKEVQLLEVTGSGSSGSDNQSGVVIAEEDWTGGFEGNYPHWAQFDINVQDASISSNPEGIDMTVGSLTGKYWEPQAIILDGAPLQEGHNYIVRITAKIPVTTQIAVNLGTWEIS